MKCKEYIGRAYSIACSHGFHDKNLSNEHYLMLVITEVAEMVEADRKQKRANVAMFKHESVTPQPEENKNSHWMFCFETFVKDTVEDEMADICIRLFDLAGLRGWDTEVDTSPITKCNLGMMLHKMSFTERAYFLCKSLMPTGTGHPNKGHIQVALMLLEMWASFDNIDIEWHIEQKMKYNDMRTRLHGKKY